MTENRTTIEVRLRTLVHRLETLMQNRKQYRQIDATRWAIQELATLYPADYQNALLDDDERANVDDD